MRPSLAVVEAIASDVRRAARAPPLELVTPIQLALRYPGIDDVRLVPGLASRGELRANDNDPARALILIRMGMTRVATAWCCTHEVIEHHLNAALLKPPANERERLVNAATAATLMPARAMLAFVRRTGRIELRALARRFVVSEFTAALRLGEVYEWPCAIVGGLWVPRSGPDIMPCDAELKAIVAAGGAQGFTLVPFTTGRVPETLVVMATSSLL